MWKNAREKVFQGMALLGFAAFFAGLLGDLSYWLRFKVCGAGAALVVLAIVLSGKYDGTPR